MADGRPLRPSLSNGDGDRSHAIIEDIDLNDDGPPVPGDPAPPPGDNDNKKSGGKMGKIGGRLKGAFSRGKKDKPPSKSEVTKGRRDSPPSSSATTPDSMPPSSSNQDLLKDKKSGKLSGLKGKMKDKLSKKKGGKEPKGSAGVPNDAVDVEAGAMEPSPHTTLETSRFGPMSDSFEKENLDTSYVPPGPAMHTFDSTTGTGPLPQKPAPKGFKDFFKGPQKGKKDRKPIVRSSNVLTLILVLMIITGIVMCALIGRVRGFNVAGPLFLGLGAFTLVGKIFFTLYFQDDPLPRLRPLTDKINEKLGPRPAPPPKANPPPSLSQLARVNQSVTPESIQMEEMKPSFDKSFKSSNQQLNEEARYSPMPMAQSGLASHLMPRASPKLSERESPVTQPRFAPVLPHRESPLPYMARSSPTVSGQAGLPSVMLNTSYQTGEPDDPYRRPPPGGDMHNISRSKII